MENEGTALARSHARISPSLHLHYLQCRRTAGSGRLRFISQEIILVMALTSFVALCEQRKVYSFCNRGVNRCGPTDRNRSGRVDGKRRRASATDPASFGPSSGLFILRQR